MMLTKKEGAFYPSYPSDYEAAAKIKDGEEVYAGKKRNPSFHRKGMALLQLGFSNQDRFDDFSIYRMVITMKAGFVNWVKGTDGKDHPLPHSLSFDKMNAEDFELWYNAIGKVVCAECRISGVDIEKEIDKFY